MLSLIRYALLELFMAAFIPKGIAELGSMPIQGGKIYVVYLKNYSTIS